MQAQETDELINKIFDGSADKLFASLLSRQKLTPEQIAKLHDLVNASDTQEK